MLGYYREPQTLHKDCVYVFGCGLDGKFDTPNGRNAVQLYGAREGVLSGPTGRCYALPDIDLTPQLSELFYSEFEEYVESHPNLTFVVLPSRLEDLEPLHRLAKFQNIAWVHQVRVKLRQVLPEATASMLVDFTTYKKHYICSSVYCHVDDDTQPIPKYYSGKHANEVGGWMFTNHIRFCDPTAESPAAVCPNCYKGIERGLF